MGNHFIIFLDNKDGNLQFIDIKEKEILDSHYCLHPKETWYKERERDDKPEFFLNFIAYC